MVGDYFHQRLLEAGWGWDGIVYTVHQNGAHLKLEPLVISTTNIEKLRLGRWVLRLNGGSFAEYKTYSRAVSAVLGDK